MVIALVIAASAGAVDDDVAVSKMALITVDGSVEIDAAPAKVWSALTDADKVVVIYVDAGKELRLAHVPDSGSYLCQARFTVSGQGTHTLVHVTEQYSDALDVPTDRDTAISKQMIAKYLGELKVLAEKK
jgi:hypothetical protein